MASKKKLLQAAAGSAGGAGLDVDEVFHTEVYDGNGNVNIRTTGIDIATEGGLLWFKTRTGSTATNHCLIDTERPDTGSGYPYLQTNSTAGNELSETPFYAGSGIEPTTTGYQLGQTDQANKSGQTYVNWTFRKAKKFFDVVTYTGNFTAGKTVSHNLGSVPAMIIFKDTSNTRNWYVYHRSLGKSTFLSLDQTIASFSNTFMLNNTDPTSTEFTLGEATNTNANGATFVAYLFAHNDGDGEFGPDSDQDIIKCGSYTGNGSADGPTIDLGFEPQWLLIKNADNGYNWIIQDAQRGINTGSDSPYLMPNTSDPEYTLEWLNLTPTGFKIATTSGVVNGNGNNIIYMAIRRGPLAAPDDATKVFAIDTRGSTGDGNEPAFRSTFPVDFALQKIKNSGTNWTAKTRLLGAVDLNPNTTGAEQGANNNQFDYMNGHFAKSNTDANEVGWMWKRAPEYFDVVVYSGPSGAGNISHNLGVVPEMMWVKNTASAENWAVYHKDLGNTYYLHLNTTAAASNTDGGNFWNSTTPTASVFSVGTGTLTSHYTRKHVAYLFATVPNVSKVGSYTGTGSALNIDCGFSSGARFVMVKRTDTTGAWRVFDTERGIVSGADPFLDLDSTAAENSGDLIDPYSSGFSLSDSGNGNVNASGNTYIFYAIA